MYYQSTLYNLPQMLACLRYKKRNSPPNTSKLFVKEYLETLERMVRAIAGSEYSAAVCKIFLPPQTH